MRYLQIKIVLILLLVSTNTIDKVSEGFTQGKHMEMYSDILKSITFGVFYLSIDQ